MQIERLKSINRLLYRLQGTRTLTRATQLEAVLERLLSKSNLGTITVQEFLYFPRYRKRRGDLARMIQQKDLSLPPILEASIQDHHRIVHAVPAKETLSVIFGPGMGNEIERTFERIGIAEQNIKDAQARYPAKKDIIWNAFLMLSTPKVFDNKSNSLYDWHSYELLERIGKGEQPLELATKAEILAHLVEMSLIAPLRHAYIMIYERLFYELFPEQHDKMFGKKSLPSESYPGEFKELMRDMQWKFRDPKRTLASISTKPRSPEKQVVMIKGKNVTLFDFLK